MNCKYCGAPLEKDDAVCKKCGKIVISDGPMFDQNNHMTTTQEAINNNANTNVNTGTSINTDTNATATAEAKQKANAKIPIIPVIIICILILAFGYFKNDIMALFNGPNDGKTVDFAGFHITLLDGYTAFEKDHKLYISNDTYEYMISIDFDYNYEQYMKDLGNRFPITSEACKANLDGRDFCGLVSTDQIMVFFTAADSTSTFVGRVKKAENMYGKDDLNDINKMLKTVKVSRKKTNYDSGGNEYINWLSVK